MSDFNHTDQLHFEFDSYPEMNSNFMMPDFNQLLANKLGQKQSTDFDPHKLMVQKKQIESGEVLPDTTPKQQWPEKDIQALEDFCQKYGILGFNCGKMSPIAAIAFLKTKMGIVDGDINDRVPYGYQRIQAENTTPKSILHG